MEKARAINNPCRFTANSSSLRDLIECEIGFEPLGALVSALFIAPQIGERSPIGKEQSSGF